MGLNVRQKRILELLAINSRFSNKDIAKQVGLSQDGVEYQINKLIKQDEIGSFFVQFDMTQLGFGNTHILIRLSDKKFNLELLEKIDEIISINTSYGKFDLQLILSTRSKDEENIALNKIRKILNIDKLVICEFKNYYKKITNLVPEINISTNIPKNQKNFIYKLCSKDYGSSFDSSFELDDKDKNLVKSLLENPRGSYQELSKLSSLNHETVRYRIKKYVESNFILNFGIKIDYKKLGYYTNYFLFKIDGVDDNKVRDVLCDFENIIYSAKLEGEYNMICYVIAKTPQEFGEIFDAIFQKLGKYIVKSDLLFFDKLHKYVQFPAQLLKSKYIKL